MSLLPKNCSCGVHGINGLPDSLFLRLSVKGGLKSLGKRQKRNQNWKKTKS
jgi:hypothetical protein